MNEQSVRFGDIADIPRRHAARTPDRIALRFEDRSATWAQWDRRCSQVAHALAASGLAAASRVGYLGKNSDRFFDVLFGAAKAGMVAVPLNWRLAPPEMRFILDDAQCEILFVGADYLPVIDDLRKACPRIRQVIGVDGPSAGVTGFDAWLSGHADTDPMRKSQPDDVVLQLYTSGTTGLPKGAQLTHRNLMFSASLGSLPLLGAWRDDDVSVLPLPLFHAGGVVYGLNGPYAGATTIVVREPNPVLIMKAMNESPTPVTRVGVVPAVLQMMLEHPEFAPRKFADLRTMTYGGSPIPPVVLRRAIEAIGPVLVQLFGMTETATVGTALLPSDHDPENPLRLTSCGRALPGVELRIVDAGGGETGPGESGEIHIRSDAVMKGYWNRPGPSAEALRDGWYHTGDVGYLDADGYLYIRDRLKDMIISGGENIYPVEVERALAEHPAIADAAVIGVPDAKWGEAVKAVVVLRAGQSASEDEILQFARSKIAGYKCPKSIDFAQQLPRNASGKLLKRVLREPYWAGHSRNVS